jgi:hypothetical protein
VAVIAFGLVATGTREELVRGVAEAAKVRVTTLERTHEQVIRREEEINGIVRAIMETGEHIREVRVLTPDLEASDGTLSPSPGTEYALALNGVELQAPRVAWRGHDTLYRIGNRPLKLAAAVTGQESDGWLIGSSEEKVARGTYTRYDVSRDGPGFVLVKLSRLGWCPKPPGSTTATIRIGPVGIGPDKQPAMTSVTDERTVVLNDCTTEGVPFATLDVPWRVEVSISPTVSPREIDPTSSEGRQLGATLSVDLVPLNRG